MPSCIALVRAGKLRALAVTSRKRFGAASELPTVMEAGYPVEIVIWNAVVAPAGTPKDIVAKLSAEILDILKQPDVKQTFDKLGVELTPGDAEHLRVYLQSELAKFAKVVKETGIRID
jgi:tripartite-type tricarboxylate transporter receptor subunit TctC